jgi:hypothetical protein
LGCVSAIDSSWRTIWIADAHRDDGRRFIGPYKSLHKQRQEITSLRRATPSIDPDKVLERVAEKYRMDWKRLVARDERGLAARNVAMWIFGRQKVNHCAGLANVSAGWIMRRWPNGFVERDPGTTVAARKLIRTMLNV